MIRKDKIQAKHLETYDTCCIVIPSETFEEQLERSTLAVFSNLDNPDTQGLDDDICRKREDCGQTKQQDCDRIG